MYINAFVHGSGCKFFFAVIWPLCFLQSFSSLCKNNVRQNICTSTGDWMCRKNGSYRAFSYFGTLNERLLIIL